MVTDPMFARVLLQRAVLDTVLRCCLAFCIPVVLDTGARGQVQDSTYLYVADDPTYLYLCVVYATDSDRISARAVPEDDRTAMTATVTRIAGTYEVLRFELEKGVTYDLTFFRSGRKICKDEAFRDRTTGSEVILRHLELEGRPRIRGREPEGKVLLRAHVKDIDHAPSAQDSASIEGGDRRALWSRPLKAQPDDLMMWYVTPGHTYTVSYRSGTHLYTASDTVRKKDWSLDWELTRAGELDPEPGPLPSDTCLATDTVWSECRNGWKRGTIRSACGEQGITAPCAPIIAPNPSKRLVINPSRSDKEACQNWYTTFTKDVPAEIRVDDTRSSSITVDTLIRDAAFRPELGDLLVPGRKGVFRLSKKVRIELVSRYGLVTINSADNEKEFSISGVDPIEFRFGLTGRQPGSDTLEVQAWTLDCGSDEMKRSPYNKLRIPIKVLPIPPPPEPDVNTLDLLKYIKEIGAAIAAIMAVVGYFKGWFGGMFKRKGKDIAAQEASSK